MKIKECKSCGRDEMRTVAKGWIPIRLNSKGLCPACACAKAEAEAEAP